MEVAIITRGSLILADIIVIVATWLKVYEQFRDAWHSGIRIRMSVSTVMLADGVPIVCTETTSETY